MDNPNINSNLEVVAAVISSPLGFFACRRSPHKAAGGKWEFPGGKVDAGESHSQALAREIWEELNVRVEVGALILRQSTQVGSQRIDLSCYEVFVVSEFPTSSTDHDAMNWIGKGELREYDWAAPDLPVVELLLRQATPPTSRSPRQGR